MARRYWILCAGLALVVVLLGAARSWQSELTSDRDVITSSPGLEPLAAPADFRLRPGRRLCVAPVALTPDTAKAQFVLGAAGGTVRNVRVASTGPGYRAATVITPIAVGDPSVAPAQVAPPSRTILDGRVCVSNGGRHPLLVRGANDARSISAAVTSIDGRAQPDHDAALLMLESSPRSIGERLGTIFARASALTGGVVPAWLLWPLLVAVLLLVPLAVIASFADAVRADGRR